jgi:hypothetical protein
MFQNERQKPVGELENGLVNALNFWQVNNMGLKHQKKKTEKQI